MWRRGVGNTVRTSHEMLQLSLDIPVDQRGRGGGPFVQGRRSRWTPVWQRSGTLNLHLERKLLCLSIPAEILQNVQFSLPCGGRGLCSFGLSRGEGGVMVFRMVHRLEPLMNLAR
ncbi:hypothetical protein Zmor_012620 [Zophobas morio]|uniref:Uncharacterized protein n=1 Tax=Zophobas morio TaxID=2755281 RepID=A0AA38ICJ4_9CUCU|nr:hypothetical protein Zmor_012620 [Zophobas morio]